MSTRPYLGVNVNAASVEELRYRGLLEEGETLLALFDGVLLDEQRRRVGGLALSDYVALTDRRVVTWARGFFNDTVDGFEWKDVDVVNAETWDPWHGRVTLAFRLPPVAPRTRRVVINGSAEEPGSGERLVINTLDYMPFDDVSMLAEMVRWVGDQVVAGLAGEALVTAFVERFPAVERQPLQPFFTTPEPLPPTTPPPGEEGSSRRRWRWWRFGAGEEPVSGMTPPTTPGNLIASYESQRNAAAAGSGVSAMPMPGPAGALPTLPEQPSMYEVSRSLRLMLEGPRRLARGLRRATEAVSGATELVNGLQDPRVRRNAMRGIYHVAAQHEAEGGPLAPVGPVVRAAVRFAEPLEDPQAENPQARRIQVRASVRRATTSTPVEIEPATLRHPAAATPPDEAPARPEPVRRTISVRRVEPSAPPPDPEPPANEEELAAEPPAQEAPRVAPVRRIAVSRVEHPSETTTVTANGKYEE
ncbi:MAG: hypothetical protein N2378_04300 [Chloroflexaceae bacterium]|nr:hypothetical protein [Chloroflexaceae bacterium]